MPQHGVHAVKTNRTGDARQGDGQQHFKKSCSHREKGDDATSEQVIPTHIMESLAGHWESQKAKDSLFQRIEGAGNIKGNRDHKQSNREVDQVGMDRQAVGESIGSQLRRQLLDRRFAGEKLNTHQMKIHQTRPARMASTTLTVWSP